MNIRIVDWRLIYESYVILERRRRSIMAVHLSADTVPILNSVEKYETFTIY